MKFIIKNEDFHTFIAFLAFFLSTKLLFYVLGNALNRWKFELIAYDGETWMGFGKCDIFLLAKKNFASYIFMQMFFFCIYDESKGKYFE